MAQGMTLWCFLSRNWMYFYIPSLVMVTWAQQCDAFLVPITIIKSAVAQGAVCLDGSPPAYSLDLGKGEGVKNWLVYLQGGGWCLNTTMYHTKDNSIQSCVSRRDSFLGSSNHIYDSNFTNIFDNHSNASYFYNWNRVFIRYCDGGSFSGDADKPNPKTKLYYRGARIFQVVIKHLMARGMRNAENVLLAGGSAGGLGVMIHCDRFRLQFSKNVRVKCHADSSLFLRVQDPIRAKFFNTVFNTVVAEHHSERSLPAECTSKMSASECFFPQNMLRYIKSPIFILNSAFDPFQITNTFSEDLHNEIINHTVISPRDMSLLQDFRQQIIKALPRSSRRDGYLISSIVYHNFGNGLGYKGHMFANDKSKSFESAILDWFFDRAHVHLVDPTDEPFY